MSLAWESASPVPCLSLWERWPSAARTERANKEGPPPGGPSFSLSINLSCHSEEHLKDTCFAARSDVGIRTLLVANSQRSVKIVRFGNRLPRQSADWLAMTGFFDSLCQREALTEGLSFPGGQTRPPLRTSADSLCAIRAGGCGHPPLRNHRRRMRHTHGRTESSAPTSVYRASALFFLCHSEGAKRPWESVPVSCQQRPKAATYLCRSAAKARFDNRPNPRRVFPKREGRSPPSLVAQG